MLRSDEYGTTTTPAALKALLAFSATEDPSSRFDCIAIQVSGGEVTMRASDGSSSLVLRGTADGANDGRWDVDLSFFKACLKASNAHDEIRIEPSGATLTNATILRQREHGEEYEEATSLTFPDDAARTQQAFPWEAQRENERRRGAEGASMVAMDAAVLARLLLVQKATGESSCRLFLGAESTDNVIVHVGEDAVVVMAPCDTAAKKRADKVAEDAQATLDDGFGEEPEEKPKRGRRKKRNG